MRNLAEAGLVNWDLIPLAAVERIEVVRGGASSLYRDTAVGGVINIITRSGLLHGSRWSTRGALHLTKLRLARTHNPEDYARLWMLN